MLASPAQDPPDLPGRWRCFALITSGLTAVMGLLVLIGWHAGIGRFVQFLPGLSPMHYNSAWSFLFCGLALGAWLKGRWPMLIWTCAVLVAAIGILTGCEYLLHANFGIDQLLFHADVPFPVEKAFHPGRMSPLSALCFSALGGALLSLVAGTKRWRMAVAGTLASFVISLGVIAVIGYIFHLPGTYGWGQMTRVAPHTASGFIVLGLGLLAAVWHAERQSVERTPRWLPAAFALAATTASLVLYCALDTKQNQEIARVVSAGAESAKSQITIRAEARMRSFVRMAARWQTEGRPPQALWEADAANYLRDVPDIQAIEWLDTSHHIQWIVPLAGNEAKLGLNLLSEERRAAAVAQAEREHQPVMTRTVKLFHGGLGYISYVPLTMNGQPDGVLGIVFQAEPLFARYLPAGIAAGQTIRVSEGNLTVFERDASPPPSLAEWVVEEQVEVHGVTWQVRVWPTPAMLAQLDDPLPEIVLGAGLLGGLLLAAVCYLAQRASRLARLAAQARDAMQRALDEVKTLKGLLPICACCKRIRDDTGYWSQVDTYLHRHTDAQLSHGYCPECAAKAFKDFGLEVPEQVQAQLKERNFE